MKRIDAVIRRERFSQVKKALDRIHCPGMMVFTFRGHGKQGGIWEKSAGRRFKIELLPKVLLTIFAPDEETPRIVDAITEKAKTGKMGDGKIFISALESAVRIRTGEIGEIAL